jgi:acetyltransferase
MINSALLNPRSIAVVGASHSMDKPGGRMVLNLLEGGFKGKVYPVNPKEKDICGLKVFNSLLDLPPVDLAILAVSPQNCLESVDFLSQNKATQAFIIIAAGFSETGTEGKTIEDKIRTLANERQLSIIGPNCIGVLNKHYKAVFVSPPPVIYPNGVDFVSASGALAVFLFDLAAKHGLRFGSIFTVGNSVCNGVEEVLQYWDDTFSPGVSSFVKMVYAEQIRKPELFFKQVHSLRKKGCSVLVLKPGDSKAGARAALSHTGAFAGDARAYALLIEKAGAIRCYSREELVYTACIVSQKKLQGRNLAIVTQAGGPAVMLTDQLDLSGLRVPEIDKATQELFSKYLNPGSSVTNPVDMLATANKDQLVYILQECEKLAYIDGMIVIYGKTGMEDLIQTYSVLFEVTKKLTKPVYAVLPSVNIAQTEIAHFNSLGGYAFSDEVVLARALGNIINTSDLATEFCFVPANEENQMPDRKILTETEVIERLRKAGIPMVKTFLCRSPDDLEKSAIQFPVVAKVMGVVHKTEVGGVILNINNKAELLTVYEKLKLIKGATGVLVQQMVSGTELFLGGKKHPGIGFSVHAGIGGIFVEIIGDVASKLVPVNKSEALDMLSALKARKLFEGYRNLPAVNEDAFAELLVLFSQMFTIYPDIDEIDLNPLIANSESIVAVDARIIIRD